MLRQLHNIWSVAAHLCIVSLPFLYSSQAGLNKLVAAFGTLKSESRLTVRHGPFSLPVFFSLQVPRGHGTHPISSLSRPTSLLILIN